MIKYFLYTILLLVQVRASSQSAVFKLTHDYFRVDPFTNTYSGFIKALITDPSLDTQEISKRTDSTLFYFTGKYKSYNPFFLKPLYTEVILAETEAPDSAGGIIYIYQLVAHLKNDKEGRKDVTTEFEKLNRKYGKGFYNNQQRIMKDGEEKHGAITDYKIDDTPYTPMTLAWAIKKEISEVILVITVRFRVDSNTCFLPIASD